MKMRDVAFRLSSISACCRVTGLSPREAFVGAVPDVRRLWLIDAYMEAACGAPILPLIVADIRAAVARGANDIAAELLVVLREALARRAAGSATLYRARRRDRAARLRRASVRTRPFPQMAREGGPGASSVLPFRKRDR
jgi:hypothetical protein